MQRSQQPRPGRRRPFPIFDLVSEDLGNEQQRATLKVVLADSHELVLEFDGNEDGVDHAFATIRYLATRLTKNFLMRLNDDLDAGKEDLPWI